MKKTITKIAIYGAVFLGGLTLLTGCEKEADKDNDNNACKNNTFYLYSLGTETDESTRRVSMLFQVLDGDKKGVVNMADKSRYSFTDYAQEMIGNVEADVQIEAFGTIPTEVYTAIVIDISRSVEGLVGDIKEAASAFVNQSMAEQRIAVYTFDGEAPKRKINYTTNKTQLLAAIADIPETNLGSSTNLYEALEYAEADLPYDLYTTSQIRLGSILVFTDGRETANPTSYALSSVTYALTDRAVFVAALKSADLDESTLKNSIASSPGNYLLANNIGELKAKFTEIQSDIEKLSKSVYWLYYTSPRRGYEYWDIKLRIKDNCYKGYEAVAEGTYSSYGF